MSIIGHSSAGSTDGLTVDSPSVDLTGANLIIALVNWAKLFTPGAMLPTDGVNTYQAIGSAIDVGSQLWSQLFYVPNASPGAGYTAHVDASSIGATSPSIAVIGLSGAKTSPLDGHTAFADTNTTIQAGSISPAESNEILIAGLLQDTNPSISINESYNIIETVTNTSNALGLNLAVLLRGDASSTNPIWTLGAIADLVATLATFTTAPAGPTLGWGMVSDPGVPQHYTKLSIVPSGSYPGKGLN